MKTALAIEPHKAAALFIDLQEEHRSDRRFLVEGFDRVVERCSRLQAAARAADIPVYHSAYIVDMADGSRPFHPTLPDGRSAFSDSADPLTAVCAEVGPAGDEMLVVKTEASSLASGILANMLRSSGVDWLFVAGVWTEACVAATVKDAVEAGFRVVLVKDACGSGTAAMHQSAVLNIANRLYGGAVTDAAGACRLMAGDTINAWQVQDPVPFRFTYEDAAGLYEAL